MGEPAMNEYLWHSEQELIAIAHLAAMERVRREREEEAKRHLIELVENDLLQPNDFAD
jgi:thioredoxin-like negative regulator of GroEL